jgi:hypothetical protein
MIVPMTECACMCPQPTVPIGLPTCTYVFKSCRREFSKDLLFPGTPAQAVGPTVECDNKPACCPECACSLERKECGTSTKCFSSSETWVPAACLLHNASAEYTSMKTALGYAPSTICSTCPAQAGACGITYTTAGVNVQIGMGIQRAISGSGFSKCIAGACSREHRFGRVPGRKHRTLQ